MHSAFPSDRYWVVGAGGAETPSPSTIDELGLTPEQIVDFSAAFDLYNANENDFISTEELQGVLKDVGCSTPAAELLKSLDKDHDGQLSKFEFLMAMAQVGKK